MQDQHHNTLNSFVNEINNGHFSSESPVFSRTLNMVPYLSSSSQSQNTWNNQGFNNRNPQTEPVPRFHVSSSRNRLVQQSRFLSNGFNNENFEMENHDDFNFSENSEESQLVQTMSKEQLKKLKKKRIGHSSSHCTVCHDHYQKGEVIRVLPCQHFFHYKCLKPWFKKSNICPLCRLNIKEVLEENQPSDEQFLAFQNLWNNQ